MLRVCNVFVGSLEGYKVPTSLRGEGMFDEDHSVWVRMGRYFHRCNSAMVSTF